MSCTDKLCQHTEHEGSHEQNQAETHGSDHKAVNSHHDHSNTKGEASVGCGCQNSELFTAMQHLKYRPGNEVEQIQFAQKYDILDVTILSVSFNFSNEIFRPPIG